MQTPEWEALRAFRQHVYPVFGCRHDALFELLDALLSAPTIDTPAQLSLAPSCQRGWGSLYLYDSLTAGSRDLAALERLVATYPLADEFALSRASTIARLHVTRFWAICDADVKSYQRAASCSRSFHGRSGSRLRRLSASSQAR